jgi:hypothetical protein
MDGDRYPIVPLAEPWTAVTAWQGTVGAGALPIGWEPWPGAAGAGCAPGMTIAAAPLLAPGLSDADVERLAMRAADIVVERIAELLKDRR